MAVHQLLQANAEFICTMDTHAKESLVDLLKTFFTLIYTVFHYKKRSLHFSSKIG